LASIFYIAWGILLQRYCGCEDVIFGTVVSGRSADIKGIEDMVGLFINTIPLRVQSAPDAKLIDIVTAAEAVLRRREEFEHTPLAEIGSYSTVGGGGSLFDTIVGIENYPLDNRLMPEGCLLSINSYSMMETTHYDLSVGIMLFNEIEIKFSFKPGLLEKEAIEKLAIHFKRIIQTMLEKPGMALSQLEIISNEEKNRVLYEFNDTAAEYPEDKTIHQLFEEQVERTPDGIALHMTHRTYMTYTELNRRANLLVGLLRKKGIQPGTIVSIKTERSIEMIIGILGILKAGGAYMPIDTNYPQERIDFLLKDSAAKILVTADEIKDWLLHSTLTSILSQAGPADPVYVIYTSGSTGKPKGTLVEHRSLVNLCYWHNRYYGVTEKDNATQYAGFGFDAAVWEIFPYLIKGAALHIVNDQVKHDIALLGNYYNTHHITIGFLPTQFCQQFIEEWSEIRTLRVLLTGGDKLNRIVETDCRLYNNYGPTENTVVTTVFPVEAYRENIPIGKPIDNTRVYILNKENTQLQPVGVPVELCISGM
jgi:amino acid adenylation domain-containing protein